MLKVYLICFLCNFLLIKKVYYIWQFQIPFLFWILFDIIFRDPQKLFFSFNTSLLNCTKRLQFRLSVSLPRHIKVIPYLRIQKFKIIYFLLFLIWKDAVLFHPFLCKRLVDPFIQQFFNLRNLLVLEQRYNDLILRWALVAVSLSN